MTASWTMTAAAVVALLPAGIAGLRARPKPDAIFWGLLAVAVAGPAALAFARTGGVWSADLATALWVTVAASMALFAVVSAWLGQAWRLAPLLSGYLVLVAILASLWQQVPEKGLAPGGPSSWVAIHIAAAVATYGLVTIAAVAALAAFLQERAIKIKRPTALTRLLPAVAECETLVVRLLMVGEAVLGIGLMTGMAALYLERGTLLAFDHKTVLTIAAFVVIGLLLIAHFRTGVRGRQAARIVLLAYLLLTLGYPGVKFVTDVILER